MRLKNKDIAEKLGISTTAVSLALNNRPGVSEETRRKVLELVNATATEAIQNMSQEEDMTGRSVLLSVHKKHGMIINDKPFFSDIVENVQQELLARSYSMILTHYTPDQEMEHYVQYINSLPVAGTIIMATELDQADLECYKKLKTPIVLMDGSFDLQDVDSVSLDNQTAVFRSFDYAYQMGHRNIGYLKSSVFINNFGHHFDGFLKGIHAYHLEQSNHPVIPLPCNVEDAYLEMDRFLSAPPAGFTMPSIFLADLDYIAVGAMRALKEHGYRIPEDVSMIGYDDVSVSAACEPPLTTTRVNHAEIGKIAVRVLLDRLANPRKCTTTTQVSSELILRSSVKKLIP